MLYILLIDNIYILLDKTKMNPWGLMKCEPLFHQTSLENEQIIHEQRWSSLICKSIGNSKTKCKWIILQINRQPERSFTKHHVLKWSFIFVILNNNRIWIRCNFLHIFRIRPGSMWGGKKALLIFSFWTSSWLIIFFHPIWGHQHWSITHFSDQQGSMCWTHILWN